MQRGSALIAAATTIAVLLMPGAASAKRCRSGQFDRGGTCTSYRAAARQVAAITRSVMAAEGAKAVILRVDIGGRPLVKRGFGESMEGVPARANMHFRPGSMTIPMLMTVLLQLQEEHKLSLDDTLSRWYPNYPNAARVTLRMLASSTSGYPDYIQGNPTFSAALLGDVFRHWTDDELLSYAFDQPLACGPGACFHYAHTNFILLGRVAEKVTGRSVTNQITTRFLRPVGLRDTRITKLPAIPAPALHAYGTDRGPYEDSTTWSPSWGLGTGLVMTSTASDMDKEIRAIGSGRLLSKSAMRELLTPYSKGLPGAPPTVDYGLGVLLANGWLFQNPQFNGYIGFQGYLPSRGISIVVENTNGPKADVAQSISGAIAKRLTQYLAPDQPLFR